MKHYTAYLLSFIAIIFVGFVDGSPDELDKGWGVLAIDKKVSDLKLYLQKGDSAKMKSNEREVLGIDYTSVWTVKLSKANMTDFFGLKVTSIEVYCGGGELSTADERVQTFVVYTEKPKDSATSEAFRLKVWDKYGEPSSRMFSPDYTEVVYDSWFSDSNRLLDLVYGTDVATGDKFDYYEASFR